MSATGILKKRGGAKSRARNGRSISVAELAREIDEAAIYIEERRSRPKTIRSWDDPEKYKPDDAFNDPEKIKRRINQIIHHVKSIDRVTAQFDTDDAYGRIDQFHEAYQHIRKVREHALNSLPCLHDALACTVSPQLTRALEEQRCAVRLADGICGVTDPRHVRDVAKRIMEKAGIEEPTERAITYWLKEIRKNEKENSAT